LTEAAKRLGERLKELRAIEIARAQRAEHVAVASERDRLAMESDWPARWRKSLGSLRRSTHATARSGTSTQRQAWPLAISAPCCREQRPPLRLFSGIGWVRTPSSRLRDCGHCQLFLAGHARRTNCASSDLRVRQGRFEPRLNGERIIGDVRPHALRRDATPDRIGAGYSPACGSRRVTVVFEPTNTQVRGG
jgi:hypothetical protein